MAKYRKNEETVEQTTVSPSESKQVKKPASKKPVFEVIGTHGRNFAIGGRFFNTGKDDFITPNGRVYKGIANDQDSLRWVYDYAPLGSQWVKAPKDYRAPWYRFVKK